MFTNRFKVWCPVGDHLYLGERIKGRICAFICAECQFKHTWDEDGKVIKSEKIAPSREIKFCGCKNCRR